MPLVLSTLQALTRAGLAEEALLEKAEQVVRAAPVSLLVNVRQDVLVMIEQQLLGLEGQGKLQRRLFLDDTNGAEPHDTAAALDVYRQCVSPAVRNHTLNNGGAHFPLPPSRVLNVVTELIAWHASAVDILSEEPVE